MLRKYLPVALALAACVAGGTAPALARTRHQPPAHPRLYMYAPSRAVPLLAPAPDLQVYPNPIQRTGSAANAEDLRPGY